MKNTNFPKPVSPFVSMSYGLVQRCSGSYKDFIFAPIDHGNPLRALFRPLKPTWYYKSAYGGSKNVRITVLSIGYWVRCLKYRCSYTSSVSKSPSEALLVLDRGKVTPPRGGSETVLGCSPVQTRRERKRETPSNPLIHKPRPSDGLSGSGGKRLLRRSPFPPGIDPHTSISNECGGAGVVGDPCFSLGGRLHLMPSVKIPQFFRKEH